MADFLGEFATIDRLLKPLARHPASLGLTDDAAVLTPTPGTSIVISKDVLVEGVHYFADDPPADIAAKALRVNLSDLASMGAKPVAYLMGLALTADKRGDWLEQFVGGLAQDQDRYGISLIGGDITSTPGPMTISITILGEIEQGKAVRRNGAKVGDAILVSGTIGDAALGLALIKGEILGNDNNGDNSGALLARYRRPQPRLALADMLLEVARSAIDVSDGLVADCGHLARESGVKAVIEAQRVPFSTVTKVFLGRDSSLLPRLLTGGDDYEILFTVVPEKVEKAIEMALSVHIPLTLIGHIEGGEGVVVIDDEAEPIPLRYTGFRHF